MGKSQVLQPVGKLARDSVLAESSSAKCMVKVYQWTVPLKEV